MHKTVMLDDDEMKLLDDGQGWWKDGDVVVLGGEEPDENDTFAAMVTLNVNGENVCDNWAAWVELPAEIMARAK